MFIPFSNLESKPTLHSLYDLAKRRDDAAQDHEVTINRSHISAVPNIDREGCEVFIGQTPIGSDGGWKGLAEMLRSPREGVPMPVPVLRSLDPETLNSLLDARITQANKQVRVWAPEGGKRIIRGIVSPGYKRITASEQVDQLLTRLHDSQWETHRVVNWSESPDSWAAEVVDAERGLDSQRDAQQSPSFSGFKFRANDVGSGAASVMSYLWRLVCSNGMVAMAGNATLRAIHRGSGDWSGNLHTGADWLNLLEQARNEAVNPEVDLFQRLRQLANTPSNAAVRRSLDEALKLSAPGEPITRWAIAQGAAAAANRTESESERQELQRWSGKILELPIRESLPVLEADLVAA